MKQNGFLYIDDDESYFAHAAAMAFGEFPSYAKESWTTYGATPAHSIGPSILALPVVYAFSWVDRLENNPMVESRNAVDLQTRKTSWSAFGFALATLIYFWFTCFLLYAGLRFHFDEKQSVLTVVLMVIVQVMPLYVFRRPVFPHIYELFIQSALVFWWLKKTSQSSLKNFTASQTLLLGGLLSFTVLVRYNNIFSALVWIPVLLPSQKNWKEWFLIYWKKIGLILSMILVFFLVFKIYPGLINEVRNDSATQYERHTFLRLLKLHPIDFYFKRFFQIFFGVDWGLVFTAPFLLAGLAGIRWMKTAMRKELLLLLLPSLVNLYIVIMWNTQASWYGYRYLVFMLFPLLVYPLGLLLKSARKDLGAVIFPILTILATVSTFSMIFFAEDINYPQLNLKLVAGKGWVHDTFQIEVWKTFLTQPIELLRLVAKGPLSYFVYLLASLGGLTNMMPQILTDKYSSFNATDNIRTFLIIFTPIILLFLFPLREKIKK